MKRIRSLSSLSLFGGGLLLLVAMPLRAETGHQEGFTSLDRFADFASFGEQPAVSDGFLTEATVSTRGVVRLPDISEEEESGLPKMLEDKPFSTITTDIRPSAGTLPTDHAGAKLSELGELWHGTGFARSWPDQEYCWEASGLYHRPLYFEDVNLERHGHRVRCVQPLVSAARFYCTVPALPYLMALDSPRECMYTLGESRPGSCHALQVQKYPLRLGPAAIQALVVTGLIFAIP
jgi:hypothetical protein